MARINLNEYLSKTKDCENTMNTKIYKCFIASPSDVIAEREVCDEVFKKINKNLGDKFNFRIEGLKWEDASPSIDSEPQAVINKQLLYQSNLFIGILHCHFGTPTKNYESGTEEEFYFALEKYEDDPSSIEIKMYFNDESMSPSKLDSDQNKKVQSFKALVAESGCLYKSYKGVDEFEQCLRDNLMQYFTEIYAPDNTINQTKLLEKNLSEALLGYADQTVDWVDRTLCKTENLGETFNDAEKIDIQSLINKPYSAIIEGPPQSGLTCLSHYCVLEAYKKHSKWIYLNANKVRQFNGDKSVENLCSNFNYNLEDIKCIVLDSWKVSKDGMMKLLRNLIQSFENIPIIVMSTIDGKPSSENINIEREFEKITLLPLTKKNIRTMVNNYPTSSNDDEIVLNKIILDFNTLNIHRTPAHCLMLLKILENPSLENPVNRTKMLSMLLSVIFDYAKIPDYSSKPDTEHCEFILGSFCENMIDNWEFLFTQKDFTNHAERTKKDQKINIDIYVIFDILATNHIIVKEKSKFKFRNAFWVYYFVAKRMKISNSFRDKILANKKYLSFIEMIEFYAGIDRNENDLVDILIKDLQDQCDSVEEKTGLNGDIDPLATLKIDASEKEINNSYQSIKKEIFSSHLPQDIKDGYADNSYNIQKPYDQNIYKIYEEYFFLALEKQIRACSRVLRNSDFIDPEKKVTLLKQITRGWYLFSKLIFVLTHFFAKKGSFDFYGVSFRLSSDFDKYSDEEKIKSIIISISCNIVKIFYDDLYSERLSPVFFDTLNIEKISLIKHCMILLLIEGKPKEWEDKVLEYVKEIGGKSAHLASIEERLIHTYKYGYMSEKKLNATRELFELIHTKKLRPKSKHLIDERKSLLQSKKLNVDMPKRIFPEEE